MIIIIFTILLFAVYAGLIIYYRQSWLSIPSFVNRQHPIHHLKNEFSVQNQNTEAIRNHRTSYIVNRTYISVIIPARNEEENIQNCLQSVITQTYPKHLFEIIVVDDFSTDDTVKIVRSFSDKNVTLISLENFTENRVINSYKKKAIEIAV